MNAKVVKVSKKSLTLEVKAAIGDESAQRLRQDLDAINSGEMDRIKVGDKITIGPDFHQFVVTQTIGMKD